MAPGETDRIYDKLDDLAKKSDKRDDKLNDLTDKVGRMDERLKAQILPGGAPMCIRHDVRVDDLEKDMEGVKTAQGKQNLIAVTLAAITTGMVLAIKAWFVK